MTTVRQAALNAIQRNFSQCGISATPSLITIHIANPSKWTKADVKNPHNKIHMILDPNTAGIPAAILHERDQLAAKRRIPVSTIVFAALTCDGLIT